LVSGAEAMGGFISSLAGGFWGGGGKYFDCITPQSSIIRNVIMIARIVLFSIGFCLNFLSF
jgi:hypothetical protein